MAVESRPLITLEMCRLFQKLLVFFIVVVKKMYKASFEYVVLYKLIYRPANFEVLYTYQYSENNIMQKRYQSNIFHTVPD